MCWSLVAKRRVKEGLISGSQSVVPGPGASGGWDLLDMRSGVQGSVFYKPSVTWVCAGVGRRLGCVIRGAAGCSETAGGLEAAR